MNFNELRKNNKGYFEICREERNLAAILYHLLLINNNLELFLKKIEYPHRIKWDEVAIYFEYSHLRDLWYHLDSNEDKRNIILQYLKLKNNEELKSCSIEYFNVFFGATPKSSKNHIQSPSKWSITKFHENVGKEDFIKVCQFKWCFNVKPDIVIHTSKNDAICIETKLESGEGKYPSNPKERRIFKDKKENLVGQLSIQKMLMDDILNINTQYLLLTKNISNNKNIHKIDGKEITWKEIFENLDLTGTAKFIQDWLKRKEFRIY